MTELPTGNIDAYYVTWTESTTNPGTWEEVLSTTKPENWSNYNEGKWANMKTVAKTAYAEGKYSTVYWVWIPRYAYKVPVKPTNSNYTGNPIFEIAFLKGKTNNPVNPSDVDGTVLSTDEVKQAGGVVEGQWVVHPAFDFGGEQLRGIWVAKYEASSSNEIAANSTPASVTQNRTDLYLNSVPSTVENPTWSWTNISISNIFAVCRNMTSEKSALDGVTNSDPHMMKNVEWGSIAYLAQSKYGQMREGGNNQTYINNYKQSDNYYPQPGFAGIGPSTEAASTNIYEYNTTEGIRASTTGTIYGVYDMSGGSWERVAAYVETSYAVSTNANFTNLINAEEKYKDVYTAAESEDQQDNYDMILVNGKITKYGDAMYETSYQGTGECSWQHDRSAFPFSNKFVFGRGGRMSSGVTAGIFHIDYSTGATSESTSFRPVCI